MDIQGSTPLRVMLAVPVRVADHEDLSLVVGLLALLHHYYVIQLPVEGPLVVLSHHLAMLPLHLLWLGLLLGKLYLAIWSVSVDVVLKHE